MKIGFTKFLEDLQSGTT